jgi:hypothetical protein
MKRSAPLQRRTPLKERSDSETAQIKERIQALLRAAVIQRDGGCIFRHYSETEACGGYRKDGELILQADHLNTRARNISYGDCGSQSARANGITFFGNHSTRTNTCASRAHRSVPNAPRSSTE